VQRTLSQGNVEVVVLVVVTVVDDDVVELVVVVETVVVVAVLTHPVHEVLHTSSLAQPSVSPGGSQISAPHT
jgi:hypothetical protein